MRKKQQNNKMGVWNQMQKRPEEVCKDKQKADKGDTNLGSEPPYHAGEWDDGESAKRSKPTAGCKYDN